MARCRQEAWSSRAEHRFERAFLRENGCTCKPCFDGFSHIDAPRCLVQGRGFYDGRVAQNLLDRVSRVPIPMWTKMMSISLSRTSAYLNLSGFYSVATTSETQGEAAIHAQTRSTSFQSKSFALPRGTCPHWHFCTQTATWPITPPREPAVQLPVVEESQRTIVLCHWSVGGSPTDRCSEFDCARADVQLRNFLAGRLHPRRNAHSRVSGLGVLLYPPRFCAPRHFRSPTLCYE